MFLVDSGRDEIGNLAVSKIEAFLGATEFAMLKLT